MCVLHNIFGRAEQHQVSVEANTGDVSSRREESKQGESICYAVRLSVGIVAVSDS